MDGQTNRRTRRNPIRSLPKILSSNWIMESASEELRYIKELITGGHPTGKAVQHGEDTDSSR